VSSIRHPAARWLVAAAVVLAAAIVVLVVAVGDSSRPAPRSLQSMFQDDDHLIYASTATVTSTLDTLARLGVQEIRATVLWRAIAPDPGSSSMPAGFVASDPADYPAAAWAPYDRLVELARARGIGVDLDLTGPGPRWAMARGAPSAEFADNWAPSAGAFAQFVQAVGRRYSGRYHGAGGAPLPRVDYWSVWNEPNQTAWLAPQWQRAAGRLVLESAVLYRAYVNAAFTALADTGHAPGTDTILIGELAPTGAAGPPYTYSRSVPPMTFLRALYCVNGRYRPMAGTPAIAFSCPAIGGANTFGATDPALFDATGFALHPYSSSQAPNVGSSNPNFLPLSDLGRLEHGLDAIFGAYGVDQRIPLYLTEYGYQTNPPNRYGGVSPALQALYLNEAEYMAWRNPRVRALSQFLLYDAPPDRAYPRGSERYWSTPQTGLLFAGGAAKPALEAYRLPIFIPDPVLRPGAKVLIWARLRPAPHAGTQRAEIQWRSDGGSYRTLATASASEPSGVLVEDLQLPGPGEVRIAWSPRVGGTLHSRAASVTSG
jgi:hypothetical protein